MWIKTSKEHCRQQRGATRRQRGYTTVFRKLAAKNNITVHRPPLLGPAKDTHATNTAHPLAQHCLNSSMTVGGKTRRIDSTPMFLYAHLSNLRLDVEAKKKTGDTWRQHYFQQRAKLHVSYFFFDSGLQ